LIHFYKRGCLSRDNENHSVVTLVAV